MQSVSLLCNKGIFMKNGGIVYDGFIEPAIDHYLGSFLNSKESSENCERRPGSGEYRFTSVEPMQEYFEGGDVKAMRFHIERKFGSVPQLFLSAHLTDRRGIEIAQFDSRLMGQWFPGSSLIEGIFQFSSPWLKPGSYRMDFFVCAVGVGILDQFEGACTLNVSPVLPYPNSSSEDGVDKGMVFGEFSWRA